MILVSMGLQAAAQGSYTERVKAYVQKYGPYAVADQRSSGVPAAITLAQGVLETEAGNSELMVKANNHFGIKCKNEWKGETFLHTDDAKDECFKKYKDAQESYNDHSAHLHRNQRYNCLFAYSPTDYKKWAHGLKKCGYATNPKYAFELIKIIEEFELQQYTVAAIDSVNAVREEPAAAIVAAPPVKEEKIEVPAPAETPVAVSIAAAPPVAATVTDTVVTTHTTRILTASTEVNNVVSMVADTAQDVVNAEQVASPYPPEEPINDEGKELMVNGLKAIYCHKGEALLQYAVKYNIRYSHLLEMNDLQDEPLPFDTYIYLEKKNLAGIRDKHVVRPGETLLMVAQKEGLQLKKLATLNMMTIYEQPQGGATLNLQTPATEKPPLETSAARVYVSEPIGAYEGTMALNVMDTAPKQDNMISTKQPETTAVDVVSYGMSFQAPKAEAQEVKQDTASKRPNNEIAKQVFMKDDPPQMQLKKPKSEPDYKTGDKHYVVKRGETAYSIAKKNGLTVEQLLEMNSIEATDLKAGQTIIVKP